MACSWGLGSLSLETHPSGPGRSCKPSRTTTMPRSLATYHVVRIPHAVHLHSLPFSRSFGLIHAHTRPLTPTHAHSRSFTRSWRGYDRHRCEGKGVHELRRPKRVVVRRWTTPTTMGVFSQEINSLLSFFNVQVNPRYLCQFQGAFSYAGSSRFDVDVALRPWARPRQTQQENPSET